MRELFTLILSCIFIVTGFAQTDIEGSHDFEFLGRMPDYYISRNIETEFDSHRFFVNGQKKVVEGRKIKMTYTHIHEKDESVEKPGRLQIVRNYSNAIKKAGGQVIFERHNAEWGHYHFQNSEGKTVWVEVRPRSISGRKYDLNIIVQQEMRQDIVIDAELIKTKIEISGRIAIYGIQFDVGKDIIKPESKETLQAIAEYLKNNPSVNCWVVGHTDADGSFELNSKLSLERAKAVKMYLEKNHGIASTRLFAEGVGPLAPISTNATEAGKQLNRRVELVKK